MTPSPIVIPASARWVDFHAHADLWPDPAAVLAGLGPAGIAVVGGAMDLESCGRLRDLAAAHPGLVPACGIHPARAGEAARRLGEPAFRRALEAAAAACPLVSEIGLDGLWCPDVAPADQLSVFRFMLDLAREFGKPVVIHTKDAEAEVARELALRPGLRAVVHWYSGPEEPFRALLGLGCWFTFGPETVRSPVLQDYCRRVPADRLLAETDNPVGEPWLGGSDSSPGLIRRVVADIAAARGEAVDQVRNLTAANARRLLGA